MRGQGGSGRVREGQGGSGRAREGQGGPTAKSQDMLYTPNTEKLGRGLDED